MKNRTLFGFCLGLFLLTRVYIWVAKPVEFSQITAVYMPYAHLWDSGVKPYLQQWYEYPPATIPLFYLPHLIDKSTMNYIWHINYGFAYRGIILLIDVGLFILIWKTLLKYKVKASILVGALIYYTVATAKAHDFIYDSMDLVFVAAVVGGIMAPFFFNKTGRFWGWFGYFLAVGLKLINAPLGLIYAVMERDHWRKLALNIFLAGMIVWLIPVGIYRSSLAVMLVYHAQRGLQVESVPAQIAAMINCWSQTEAYQVVYQSVSLTGPVSSQLTKMFNWLLIVAVVSYILWGARKAWTIKPVKQTEAKLALTFGYFFCFMFFGKVLSTPYLLWQIPLLALYPYKSSREQLLFTIPSFVMIAISMTSIPNLELGFINLHLLIGLTRSAIIAYLLWRSVRLVKQLNLKTTL